MYVSIDWLSDFVDIGSISPQEIYKRVTLSTCEVEGIEVKGQHWKEIVVAQIVSIRKHPEADKLNLVTFEFGSSLSKEVVCGAPNVAVDLKVPYAPIGTTLPGGFKLEPKKIRGILSEGMLCSRSELGIEGDSSGLMILPADAPLGQTLLEYLQEQEDIILDIDNKSLTHRPDLWGHLGMAREMSTIFKYPLKNPYVSGGEWEKKLRASFDNKEKSPMTLKSEGESALLAYYGYSVDNIKVEESPRWLQRRLISAGLRPINNIVDISNYVMFELGIPNHIFDRDQIGSTIILKRVGSEVPFQTLDEVQRTLLPQDTVVADENGPLVIAGIMGGLKSGVTDKTSRLFVEVANWKYAEVRKTSSRIGLRTDSSQRYEKSLDSALLPRTALRILDLILTLCPGAKVIGTLDHVGTDLGKTPLIIPTSYSRLNQRLGKKIAKEEIDRIFTSLDFGLQKKGEDELLIAVPSNRATKDIEYEVDLVEEIGRMVGYDAITPESPLSTLNAVRLLPAKQLQRRVQDFWVLQGKSLEVLTHPLLGGEWLKEVHWPSMNDQLVLQNAMSNEHERLRPSLIPTLLKSVILNQKHLDRFRLFEVGRVFGGEWEEKNHVGIVFYQKESSPFMDLVNLVEQSLQWMRLPIEFLFDDPRWKNGVVSSEWEGRHPHEYYHIQVMGKIVGAVTSLHPLFCKKLKLRDHLAIAALDLSHFEQKEIRPKVTFKSLPKFPGSTFDCTVVAPEKCRVLDLVQLLKKQVKLKEFQKVEVVTVFPMGNDQKAVTLRTIFGNDEETMSGEFLEGAFARVVKVLNESGYPLRS